jgi:hypothetical protein
MYIGKPVSSKMLRAVRRLRGHESTGSTTVFDQSMERIKAAISPPPAGTVLLPDPVVVRTSMS